MKNLILLLVVILLSSFTTTAPATFSIDFVTIMAIIAGIWEVIGRLLPSVGQITLIGKLIEILSWLSNFLNHKKL